MADETESGAPQREPSGGGGGNVFMRKLGPAPLWLWMAAGLGVALAWSAIRKNKTAQTAPAGTASTSSTTAAGSLAAQTPPFIIQNYPQPPTAPASAPTTTPQSTSTPAPITSPQVVSVGHNESVQAVVDWAQKNGFPNFSWSDFWALNPSIPGLQMVNGNWTLTGWGTPITLAKPGFISTGGASGAISNDVPSK